ncbi:MAG TPA: ABC transporter ATP-binding protein, partial [Actinomycetes bacterium]|nr:ABC transporter ATP-binding protein [Actinomycetes bacterium]
MRAQGWGWRHAGRRAFAVRGLDLRIEPGERLLLLGPSGAGKSTLMLGLAGLLGREHEGEAEGSLEVAGVPALASRGRAGLLLQDPEAQVVLARCGDDVAFGLENFGVRREQIWPRVDEALDAVGFPFGRAHPTAALSGGEKQRLALAGVLAMRPGLLLLDEPTANLDPPGAALVRGTVRRVVEATGATLVVVEHRVAAWLDLVDRMVVLEPGGGVVADGAPETVIKEYGAALAARGVWVPGHHPPGPARRPDPARGLDRPLLHADALAVARPGMRVPAASGINLTLGAGRATAVVGPNGAGKSTVALTVAGLLAPRGGAVRAEPTLAGALVGPPHRWRARDLLARLGTVFQDPEHQFLAPTVEDELRHGPRLLGLPDAAVQARADELLDRLRLAHLGAASPYTLSGGEKRR